MSRERQRRLTAAGTRFLAAGLLFLTAGAAGVNSKAGGEKIKKISSELQIVLVANEEIYLEAKPLPGEGLNAFARRFTDSTRHVEEIQNAKLRANQVRRDLFLRIPFAIVTPQYKKMALAALFPDDRPVNDGWEHTIKAHGKAAGKNTDDSEGESLWALAVWFTGDGTNYRAIKESNRLATLATHKGQKIVIPKRLLLAPFQPQVALPAAQAERDSPGQEQLEYQNENGEDFAVYRLKRGEALYSSVVVRFTGRLHAEDVNTLAAEIADYNCIPDVTDMPIDYPVRIPFESLQAEYLPQGHPRRKEWENELLESAQFKNRVRAYDLSGINIVLDAGHGGKDIGTEHSGVWESIYVYDILTRMKLLIERDTAAKVYVTTKDDKIGFGVPDKDVLPRSKSHSVLTKPRYFMDDPVVGVNLRWYLVNSYYRKIRKEKGVEDRTVFVSLHADSLHPAVRGAMVYIPGSRFLGKPFGKNDGVYLAREEVREQPTVHFTRHECVKSEGLSRDLAEHVIAAFEKNGLPVHSFNPVRECVIRQRREWVPAILRYNEVPAKILLEICNLANREDRKLMTTRTYRQKVAEAMTDALIGFYDVPPAPRTANVRAAR